MRSKQEEAAQVPLPLVKTLREEFGISVKEAKDALLKANLDVNRARRILKGEASAPSSPAPTTAAKTIAKTVVPPLAQLKDATSKEAALLADKARLVAEEAELNELESSDGAEPAADEIDDEEAALLAEEAALAAEEAAILAEEEDQHRAVQEEQDAEAARQAAEDAAEEAALQAEEEALRAEEAKLEALRMEVQEAAAREAKKAAQSAALAAKRDEKRREKEAVERRKLEEEAACEREAAAAAAAAARERERLEGRRRESAERAARVLEAERRRVEEAAAEAAELQSEAEEPSETEPSAATLLARFREGATAGGRALPADAAEALELALQQEREIEALDRQELRIEIEEMLDERRASVGAVVGDRGGARGSGCGVDGGGGSGGSGGGGGGGEGRHMRHSPKPKPTEQDEARAAMRAEIEREVRAQLSSLSSPPMLTQPPQPHRPQQYAMVAYGAAAASHAPRHAQAHPSHWGGEAPYQAPHQAHPHSAWDARHGQTSGWPTGRSTRAVDGTGTTLLSAEGTVPSAVRSADDLLPTETLLAQLRLAFDYFDVRRVGSIGARELHDALTTLGAALSRKQLEGVIARADTSGTGRIDFADFVDAVASGLHPLHVSLPLEAAAPYEALLTTPTFEATSRGGAPPYQALHARAPSYYHAPAYVDEYPDRWKWDVPLPPSIPVDRFAERPHAWIGGRSVEIPEMNPEISRDARPWHAWPLLPDPYSEVDLPSPVPPNPQKPTAMLRKPKAYYIDIEPPSPLPPKLPSQLQHHRQHQQPQAPAIRPPPPPPPPLRPLRGEAAVRQELRRRERERLLLQLERRRAERSEVEHELGHLRREHEELRIQMHEEARRKRLGAFQASFQASQPDPTRSATPALNKLRAALPGSADAAVSAASAANARCGGASPAAVARGPAAKLAAAPAKGGAAKPAVAKGMAAKGATAPGSPKNARPKPPTKRDKVNSLAAANKLL